MPYVSPIRSQRTEPRERSPKFTPEQRAAMTVVLCASYRAGEPGAGNALVRLHDKLVEFHVRKFANTHAKVGVWSDLTQEGRLGILRAAETYDAEKGKFGNYASIWIKQKIRSYWQDNRDTVRTPVYVQQSKEQRHFIKRSRTWSVGDEAFRRYLGAVEGATVEGAGWEEVYQDKEVEPLDDEIFQADFTKACERVVVWIGNQYANKRSMQPSANALGHRNWEMLRLRNWEMLRLRHLGPATMTLLDVGTLYGVSRELVRQKEVEFFTYARESMRRLAMKNQRLHDYDRGDFADKVMLVDVLVRGT
jgi:RNA polymerase sigma factor (sigma-70 family)